MKPDPIAVLRKLEWRGYDNVTCPECLRHKDSPHSRSCALAACLTLPQSEEPAGDFDGHALEAAIDEFREQAAQPVPASADRVRAEIVEIIGYTFAALVSRNNQPCMSGDPRDRLQPHLRRQFDGCAQEAAEGIIAALSATPEQRRVEAKREAVIQAARGWLGERDPEGADEKSLFLALADLFPEDFMGREGCGCEEPQSCDECPSKAEIEASLNQMRAELGRPPRATTDHDGGAE